MLPRLLVLLFLYRQAEASLYLNETETCQRDEGYGRRSVVCDLNGRLAATTRRKLSDILTGLRDRIGCECVDGCMRADGTDAFIGLLHVTSSHNTEDLKDDMRKEYESLTLGNATCDHGLILVYLKDTQQLATYRGGDSFVLLTDDDMQKLHHVASQQGPESDTLALQYLLANYKQVSESPIQNTPWLPVVGLIVAVLLVLCLLSILLSLLCAKCFCCCRKNKKEVYQVTKPATYKNIEPLYVITPPSAHSHRMQDGIYSTPYSGSPIPPPPGTTVPLTPSSINRHKIDRNYRPKDTISRSEMDSIGHGDFEQRHMMPPFHGTPTLPHMDPTYGTIPRVRLTNLPPPGPTSPTPSSPRDQNDLQFLDPRRKQEIQTREELIY
ncbi:unnamed protein product [Caenorhabditis auriculariae]|uniref:Uncharacterized protein n=1 Tax=Caenorhabditis auriculariae TaxID=2777116 RepID=A0A8S1GQW1_9PELO|nr:unnamed protein product [Caenorhabditis auriculariae]